MHRGWFLLLCGLLASCGGADSKSPAVLGPRHASLVQRRVVVHSLADGASWTLRSAIFSLASGGTITFDPALDGGTIDLVEVDEDHTMLFGEVFPQGKFGGYEPRDYGRSALYAMKDLTIDASALPHGITLRWAGGASGGARVLAVLGDLTMRNVTVTGGSSESEAISEDPQGYTLARGGGLAVWGTATLDHCTIAGNRTSGDENASRDRGSFGGGIYADRVVLTDCVVAGNSVTGYGAAGGGVYSVGGRYLRRGSTLTRCAVTGNRITGQHAYGGGVYSDGGGPGDSKTISIANCTIAGNLVEDHPVLEEPPGSQYYYRGGGFYMSNGSLRLSSSTIVSNAVRGHAAVFNGKPNMGGGGVAATIGNAHVVERMTVWHSIVAGNTVNDAPDDLYTGSLLHFVSGGYNRLGKLDLSQILVPIPPWWSLCRKHWPKAGDEDGVAIDEVLDLANAVYDGSIVSAGTDAGKSVVLFYPPGERAADRIPPNAYHVVCTLAQYATVTATDGDLLNLVLDRLRGSYADRLGTDFGTGFGDMSGTPFSPAAASWPADAANKPWIQFWRDLDTEIGGRLGTAGLGDEFWASLAADPYAPIALKRERHRIRLLDSDQLGNPRPAGAEGDIGAIER